MSNKPASMTDKEYLIRTLAVKLAVNEKTIEAVVNHQFISANEALDVNKSVEISGFGKFMFNEKKAVKKLKKLYMKRDHCINLLEKPDIKDAVKQRTTRMLNTTLDQIKMLKPNISDELQADL